MSPYRYLNIKTMYIISSYAGENDLDWGKYIAEKSNFEILQDLLFTAYTNLSVLCETD